MDTRRFKSASNHGIEFGGGRTTSFHQSLPHNGILEQLYTILVLSSSEEVNILNDLAKKKEVYYDDSMVEELFRKAESSSSVANTMYLKNKYLYITTRGVMNYLRLYEEQSKGVNQEYYNFEVSQVRERIRFILSENPEDKLSIISLGAANSDKECRIFRDLEAENRSRIQYIPVDISNYLVHLGIMNISSQKETQNVKTQAIISDFWALSKYIKGKQDGIKNELFGKGRRLFLLLGGTFGNYPEGELLNVIESFMEVQDELIISVKLAQIAQPVSKEYEDLPGDSEFLLEPLTYIPFFYGYARYKRDLLIKSGGDTILKDNDPQKKYVSVIPKSICYAPYIKVRTQNNCSVDMRLAWSTRYILEETKEWIRKYISEDEDYIFTSTNERISEHKDDYALFFLKKEYYDYGPTLRALMQKYYREIYEGHTTQLENIFSSPERSGYLYKKLSKKEISGYKVISRYINNLVK
ncbi:hypothetical protein PORCRE_1491 [Porphyromonas crevioricanis JCM 15906]|uniref:Histidine-specific methyltransferase SAM-dependent domain-containing protein n=1 Tax=Porphyromonas crevioricanis JCM 15906 TaxID=1305617 RepID=T1CRS8_9PORP|nr:L-histidine N(alpha)-methyltransferase [Porphyromonas crevioricanis]GAD05783.1 hypothetical protein PORCRE_1491 [Porphyromonas crevioricanis JCM 15906]SJZ62373.1 Uncharacterized conserved protein, contains predicted SAM-dependent methyltransferase domain [Porphyromonas crevioricanis]